MPPDDHQAIPTNTLNEVADLYMGLPDGAIPEHGVTIVSYLLPDGTQAYGFRTHGDTNVSSIIGLLTMVSHIMMHPQSTDHDVD